MNKLFQTSCRLWGHSWRLMQVGAYVRVECRRCDRFTEFRAEEVFSG
ncbi:hypothetical protein SEA_SCHMIDT_69 [Gordonia phage Schmidt]|uniref:Uncharacterized protein n=1 Tax=Gordonia phage Schmidt TaxID=2301697 RepID=A0A385E2Q5_9CAUD|nr:hypothetical protein KDJ59_gp69 [Gordonia phage Schmidt]AXQ65188.1 hypothetical protein SEA_SCHMIDT_69 [Gordonia phage Schmidt]